MLLLIGAGPGLGKKSSDPVPAKLMLPSTTSEPAVRRDHVGGLSGPGRADAPFETGGLSGSWGRLTHQQTITVTTAADALNGDCTSVETLLAAPGPDGVSLREAITAANNTPGPELILFSDALIGARLVVGEVTRTHLPVLTGGDLTIDGDIDGDGRADVTLDGSLGSPGTPLAIGLSVWSSGNTLTHLRMEDFCTTIQFAVPHGSFTTTTIAHNCILTNTISTPTRDGIVVGPLGWLPITGPEPISNLTWEDLLIAGNTITAPTGILLYAGAAGGQGNTIRSVVIKGNRIAGGGCISMSAGDTNTAYFGIPDPIEYSDYHLLEDVLVEGNVIEEGGCSGIGVLGANMGNRHNQVRHVRILSNTVRGMGEGFGVKVETVAGDSIVYDRFMQSNAITDVEIRGNIIDNVWAGIHVRAAGVLFVNDPGPGMTDNSLSGLTISGNRISNVKATGIGAYAGFMEHNGGLVADNTLDDLVIRDNQIFTPTWEGATGIAVTGGFRRDYVSEGAVISNSLTNAVLAENGIAGYDIGLLVAGGTGAEVSENILEGLGYGNEVSTAGTVLRQGADLNGAFDNSLDWRWLEAGFEAAPTHGRTPLTVVFTNTSPVSYTGNSWHFGDGITSTLSAPSHTYTEVGNYTVTLSVAWPQWTDVLTRTNFITISTWASNIYLPVSMR